MPSIDKWRPNLSLAASLLSDEGWQKIEATIPWPKGSSPDELDRRRKLLRVKVANYVQLYYGNPYDPQVPVRSRHRRAVLEKIARQAEDLAAAVDLKEEKSLDISESWGELLALNEIFTPKDNDSLLITLRDLADRARNAATKIPADKGGRGRDRAFEGFVDALATLYSQLTSKGLFLDAPGREPGVSQSAGKYGGPFLRFIETTYRHILPDRRPKGPTGLGKAVQRALKIRRQSTG